MVNSMVGAIKEDMREAEKRIPRIAFGGIRVMNKLVIDSETVEKLCKQECEGILKA